MTARILLLDIETAPNVAHVWGLWQQNVGVNQLMASSYVMCWGAKWYGEKPVHFSRVHYNARLEPSDQRALLKPIHELLDEADIVVHYNGKSFDIPTLQKEFLVHGFLPPSPFKQVDLLQVVRRQFRFPSRKLDYVAKALGVGQKVKHAGHGLWVSCMANDEQAWAQMERYNKQDVRLLEPVYERLLPWIQNHPNLGVYGDGIICSNCGSTKIQKRGVATTAFQQYQRFRCSTCGTWMRGSAPEHPPVALRSAV